MKTSVSSWRDFAATVIIRKTGKRPLSARAVYSIVVKARRQPKKRRVRSRRSLVRATSSSSLHRRQSPLRVATGIAENLAERIGTEGSFATFATRIREGLRRRRCVASHLTRRHSSFSHFGVRRAARARLSVTLGHKSAASYTRSHRTLRG